jgi:hypothetical protein
MSAVLDFTSRVYEFIDFWTWYRLQSSCSTLLPALIDLRGFGHPSFLALQCWIWHIFTPLHSLSCLGSGDANVVIPQRSMLWHTGVIEIIPTTLGSGFCRCRKIHRIWVSKKLRHIGHVELRCQIPLTNYREIGWYSTKYVEVVYKYTTDYSKAEGEIHNSVICRLGEQITVREKEKYIAECQILPSNFSEIAWYSTKYVQVAYKYSTEYSKTEGEIHSWVITRGPKKKNSIERKVVSWWPSWNRDDPKK